MASTRMNTLYRSVRCLGLILLLSLTSAASGIESIIPRDRLTDWSPGVPGGIPHRTNVFCDVTVAIPNSPLVARADGLRDDSAALLAAVSLCPSGSVVHLPAGRYRITNPLNFGRKSNITIRGDGPGKTVIEAALTNRALANILLAGGEYTPRTNRIMRITSGCDRDSTRIAVESLANTGIEVGGLLWINQLNDGEFVTSTGSGSDWKGDCVFADRDHNGTRNLQQIVRVTAFGGNEISFTPPLRWTYRRELQPEATVVYRCVRRMGIEDLTIRGVTDGGQANIQISGADQCWVSNVECDTIPSTHVIVSQSLNCEVRDSYLHHGYGGIYAVNAGYGIKTFFCFDMLIENCIFEYLWSQVTVDAGSSGCVVGYNFITNSLNSDPTVLLGAFDASHGAHPMFNLWEGNVGPQIRADFFWGSSSHLTYFRNALWGKDGATRSNLRALSIDSHCISNNVVGNVLGSPDVQGWVYQADQQGYPYSVPVIYRLGYPNIGNNTYTADPTDLLRLDTRVAATTIRHGNFDYASRTTVWDPGIDSRAMPTSLYLRARPSWWGAARWPAIGPDQTPMVTPIPAQLRYGLPGDPPGARPGPPQNLRAEP